MSFGAYSAANLNEIAMPFDERAWAPPEPVTVRGVRARQ